MKDFVEKHQGSKDVFLEKVQPIKEQTVNLGNTVNRLYRKYQQGLIPEKILITELQTLQKRADEIKNQLAHIPLPPPDCQDFDQACQNLFYTVFNLFLF